MPKNQSEPSITGHIDSNNDAVQGGMQATEWWLNIKDCWNFTKMKERDIALKEIKTTSNWFGVFFIIFCYLYKLYNLMVIKACLQMII